MSTPLFKAGDYVVTLDGTTLKTTWAVTRVHYDRGLRYYNLKSVNPFSGWDATDAHIVELNTRLATQEEINIYRTKLNY
jgi:hypothetical protein